MVITINPGEPEPDHNGRNAPKILNFETVASYNWLDEPNPTILVPGVPPLWDPPQNGPVLKPDTGDRFVDQNTEGRLGLQTLIHAVRLCQPGFDFTKISIVTDREPVRSLLGFVRAEPVAFKFGVTLIGNTVLFTRVGKRTGEHTSRRFDAYRDAFEEQYTKIAVSAARTTSHHRVVKYRFAGEAILLRYAVDAYLRDVAEALMPADGNEHTDLGLLIKRHRRTNINRDSTSKILPSNTLVTVVEGGRHIPHAATLELTTRAEDSQAPDSIEGKMPDFWISQTLNYHLCIHRERKVGSSRSRICTCIRLVPMGDLSKGWEESNEEKLRVLADVLAQVRKAAKELGGSCIVSSDGGEGASLTVSRAEGEELPALPEDMQSVFVPVESEKGDVPMKQQGAAITVCQNGTRKRKYGTEDAPVLTGPPPARRVAPNSSFRRPADITVPTENGKFAAAGQMAHDGTRKRKLDAMEALELRDSPPARRRALNSEFGRPRQADTPIEIEEPSARIHDEPVDSEMM